MQQRNKTAIIVRLIVLGVFAAIAIIAALQNTESVETRLLFAEFHMPRALLLMITFAIGLVVGAGLMATFLRRKHR